MNSSLDYELQIRQSPGQTAAYPVAGVCVLLVCAVLSVAAAILLLALLFPGHLGLSDLLQALSNLVPAGPYYTT